MPAGSASQAASAPVSAAGRRIRRAGIAVLAFLAGMALACLLISSIVPPTYVERLTEKLGMYHRHAVGIDVLFIGSSRTGRQVRPAVFDREMTAAGHPVRSFNLGIEGMRPPEDTMVLEQALMGGPKPLRLLVVECNPIRGILDEETHWTQRAIYTHDLPRLWSQWKMCWQPSLDEPFELDRYVGHLRDHLPAFVIHCRHTCWNYARLSEGHRMLNAAINPKAPKIKSNPPPPDGFYPRETVLDPLVGAERKRYLKELERSIAKPPPPVRENRASQDELRAMHAHAKRIGARLVLVSPPFLRRSVFVPEFHGEDLLFLDFSNPARWPPLYDPDGRIDYGHLNDAASEAYSRILAREIAAFLDQHP